MTQPDVVLFHSKRFDVVRRSASTPGGLEVERDVIVHPGAVTILPLVDDQSVCMLRNRRVAVGETLWELPAGTREAGEAPEITAVRELKEETGYSAESWRKLGEFFLSPGILNELMHVYLARGLQAGEQQLDQGEEIECRVLPLTDVMSMIATGEIRDGKTIAALHLFELNVRRGE